MWLCPVGVLLENHFVLFKEAAQGGRTSGCQHELVPHREILNAFLVAPEGLFTEQCVQHNNQKYCYVLATHYTHCSGVLWG